MDMGEAQRLFKICGSFKTGRVIHTMLLYSEDANIARMNTTRVELSLEFPQVRWGGELENWPYGNEISLRLVSTGHLGCYLRAD